MNRNDRALKSRQRGTSLVEALIGVALLGVVVGGAATYFSKINSDLKIEGNTLVQTRIAEKVRLALANAENIRTSIDTKPAGGNQLLSDCISPSGVCTADATDETKQSGFYLYSATGGVPEPVAGPPSNPVAYSIDGDICTPGSPNCHFGATTYFWATCPIGSGNRPTNTCSSPTFINFRHQIVPLTGAYQGKGRLYRSYPRDDLFKKDPTAYAYRMRTSDILMKFDESCGPDQKQVGLAQDGRPKCKCLVPVVSGGKEVYDKFGRPVCAPQKCPGNNDMMVGFNANGTIRCINRKICEKDHPDCPCKTVNLNVNGDCGAGFWMVSINYGECTGTKSKGKGGKEVVECTKQTGRCCKLDIQ